MASATIGNRRCTSGLEDAPRLPNSPGPGHFLGVAYLFLRATLAAWSQRAKRRRLHGWRTPKPDSVRPAGAVGVPWRAPVRISTHHRERRRASVPPRVSGLPAQLLLVVALLAAALLVPEQGGGDTLTVRPIARDSSQRVPQRAPQTTARSSLGSPDDSIDVSWTAVARVGADTVDGYEIRVSKDGTSWTTLIADTGDTNVTYTHSGLYRGALRYYRVQALAGQAGSGFGRSGRARTTPNPPGQPVVTVTTLRGSLTSSLLRLSWPRVDDGAEGGIHTWYTYLPEDIQVTSETISGDGTTYHAIAELPPSLWLAQYSPAESARIQVCAHNYVGNSGCAGVRAIQNIERPSIDGDEGGASNGPSAQFEATFIQTPGDHDGANAFDLKLDFSDDPRVSDTTVRDGLLDVTDGTIERVWQRRAGSDRLWGMTIVPAGYGDVTVEVRATTDCAARHAVCTADGRMLQGGARVVVRGPPALSVAHASAREARGATLDFVVTLSRRRSSPTAVEYATFDGTARAGEDYEASSGTLTFTAGATSRTVSVRVLNDAFAEGKETMSLTLSNPSGARLDNATATGTIENIDPMPNAWTLRFGRTIGSHVVDGLTQRLESGTGSHVTLGGIALTGAPGVEPEFEKSDPFGLPEGATSRREADMRTLIGKDILLRSAIQLSNGDDGTGADTAFTAWGRVATGGFETEEDGVAMDGTVTTGLVGFDTARERVLAGIMFSRSKGEGAYRLDPALGDDAGTVESVLTGVYPYASVDLDAGVSAWALAGMGSGELTLEREGDRAIPTDISMRMGAVGVKGQVLDGTGDSGVDLNIKSDAMWVSTKNERTSDIVATEGDVMRLRLVLQGERVFEAGTGATFTPSALVGLRHDGGDAETGTGLEVGTGVRYGAGPLTIEGQMRALLAHETSGYEKFGMSGAIRVTPSPSGRGLMLSIAPAWGRTGNTAERLWSARDAGALGADSEFEAASRLEMGAGYGFGLGGARGVLTPYAGMTLAKESGRTVRGGARWQLGPDLAVRLEAALSERGDDTEVRLRAALRF